MRDAFLPGLVDRRERRDYLLRRARASFEACVKPLTLAAFTKVASKAWLP